MLFRPKHIKNFKKLSNSNLKRNLKKAKVNVLYRYKEHLLYVPPSWDVVIMANNISSSTVVYFLSRSYFLKFAIKNYSLSLSLDKWCGILNIKSIYSNSVYSSFIKSFFSSSKLFFSIPFKKLKFKGKGYYLYKSFRNTIAPQFGYSHRLYVYSYFANLKFLSKTAILFFGFSNSDLLKPAHNLKYLRSINIFTGRGVRFARQRIYKKQGKVSSYR